MDTPNQTVPFVTLDPLHRTMQEAVLTATRQVLEAGQYIQGGCCRRFEEAFAAYLGVEHVVGCASGLDALRLILMAMDVGPGDEVIVPAHTFIATGLAVSGTGARPVFVDVEPDYFALDPERLEEAITPRTRGILAGHLYGQVGHWDRLAQIAARHGIPLIEDGAQAHGAVWRNRKAGSLGYAAGFSFYPTKTLGALGDGGAVATNDRALAARVRLLGNYGSAEKYVHVTRGINSRLDELQAAYLLQKLPHLDRWNAFRRQVARRYFREITNPAVALPKQNPEGQPVWYVFPVLCQARDALAAHLSAQGVNTLIHYPTPMHLHEAYRDLGYGPGDFPCAEEICRTELGLPMFYGMSDEQISRVIQAVNSFCP